MLVQDPNDPQAVANADTNDLESVWRVFSEGLLAHPAAMQTAAPSDNGA